MTIEEILKELERNRGYFPRNALQEAVIKEAQITPHLLEILRYATDNMQKLYEEPDYFAHIYAMYLLAQFREKRAFPLIIEFFSVPGEMALDLTGDLVTEDLNRILLSVYNGDDQSLKQRIENRKIDEYVRSAALSTFSGLYAHNEKSREEIMDYFEELFDGRLERTFSHVWNILVYLSMKMYPEELYEDIVKAFQDDLVDDFFMGFEDVEKTLHRDKKAVLAEFTADREYSLIRDAEDELAHWACFRVDKKKPKTLPFPEVEKKTSASMVEKKKKIGKNEPCPCGSGKKYNKCCLK